MAVLSWDVLRRDEVDVLLKGETDWLVGGKQEVVFRGLRSQKLDNFVLRVAKRSDFIQIVCGKRTCSEPTEITKAE
jgi:hypothetical protein